MTKNLEDGVITSASFNKSDVILFQNDLITYNRLTKFTNKHWKNTNYHSVKCFIC